MVKFKISAERFAEVCTVTEYIGVVVGSIASQMAVLPRMIVNDKDDYIIEVVHDSEGDPVEFKNVAKAEAQINKIGVPRFEKLRKELTEAANSIVNPPKGDDSTKPPPPPK